MAQNMNSRATAQRWLSLFRCKGLPLSAIEVYNYIHSNQGMGKTIIGEMKMAFQLDKELEDGSKEDCGISNTGESWGRTEVQGDTDHSI